MPNRGVTRRPAILGLLFGAAVLAAIGALLLREHDDGRGIVTASEYVEGVAGTPQRVNPIYSSLNEVDQDLVEMVFSGLVKLSPDGQAQPDLANLPEISDGGKTYTFKLRKDARWHDGEPVTSRDVAFTIGRVTEPGFKGDPQLAAAWLEAQVETPDPQTVILHLQQPFAPFLTRNATLGILPEHILRDVSPEELWSSTFNTRPIGSGPYRLQALDSREATLTANADYHLGRPSIATIRLRFFTDYPSALRAASAGQVDGLMVRDTLTEAQLTEIGKLRGTKADQLQRTAFIVLYLNNDQAAFFQDERVRRAISLAIDRQAIVKKVFLDTATTSSSPIPPGSWAYAGEYDHAEANVNEAKQLLQEAGWRPAPASGILVREGSEFRFTIRVDSDPVRMAVASEIAAQLDQLGIKANVASTTFSVLRRDFLQERKYDAAVAGWDQGPDPDPYFGWHSSQMGSAGLNLANFADVVADSLIAQGRTSLDQEVRKDAYRQFQEVWTELEPSVVIAYPRYIYVHPDSLEGVPQGVLVSPSLRFADVYKWTI